MVLPFALSGGGAGIASCLVGMVDLVQLFERAHKARQSPRRAFLIGGGALAGFLDFNVGDFALDQIPQPRCQLPGAGAFSLCRFFRRHRRRRLAAHGGPVFPSRPRLDGLPWHIIRLGHVGQRQRARNPKGADRRPVRPCGRFSGFSFRQMSGCSSLAPSGRNSGDGW